jgi:P2-related tail formation protein
MMQVLVVEWWERDRDKSMTMMTTTMTHPIMASVMMQLLMAVVELDPSSEHLHKLEVVLSVVLVIGDECLQRIRRVRAILMLRVLVVEWWERDRSSIILKVTVAPMMTTTMTHPIMASVMMQLLLEVVEVDMTTSEVLNLEDNNNDNNNVEKEDMVLVDMGAATKIEVTPQHVNIHRLHLCPTLSVMVHHGRR